jgi:hypothetical protein
LTNIHYKSLINKYAQFFFLKQTRNKNFIFLVKDVHSNSCFFHFKLILMPNEIYGLHYELLLKKNLLVELCVGNYIILNGLINGANKTF